MKHKLSFCFLFLLGACSYGLIEILWRGHTHWSMPVAGGICLMLLYTIEEAFSSLSLCAKCLFGAFLITGLEFTAGCLVNLTAHLAVWDYSDLAFNFLGQTCLLYSVLWYLLCFPAFAICHLLHNFFQHATVQPASDIFAKK